MMRAKSDKIFDAINYFFLLFIFIIVLYPLAFTVIASISDPTKVAAGSVFFRPVGFTLDAYKNVFLNKEIWIGYKNTIFYTLAGTSFNLFITITCAFALARKNLVGKSFIIGIFVFTMYFNGGLIPTYLLIKNLGMIDSAWAMLIPGALSVYNLIVARTFFQNNIPEELYEAARIDGCSDIGMFVKIALPLAAPIIAVMALFYGVGHWNQFFNALIYISNRELYPLQLVLRNILLLNQAMVMDLTTMTDEQLDFIIQKAFMAETMKYALIFVATFPILAVYPFIQKYFDQGIMVGALKG